MTGHSAAGQAKSITLGEVVRAALPRFAQTHRLPAHHWEVLRTLSACHTPSLGGHQYRCAHCQHEHFVPHSCGNRHCPSCQKLDGAQWLEQQTEHLLPIPYFHVVFTLPHDLNPLLQHNQWTLYSLLFASPTATLLEFGRNNLQATLGITAVLHTWGQNLSDHYHLHCVVTGVAEPRAVLLFVRQGHAASAGRSRSAKEGRKERRWCCRGRAQNRRSWAIRSA